MSAGADAVSSVNTPAAATYDDTPVLRQVVAPVLQAFVSRLSPGQRRVDAESAARSDCAVTPDGHVTGCKTTKPEETPGLADGLMQHIQQADVQGPPMTLAGEHVAGRHVFEVAIRARRVRR